MSSGKTVFGNLGALWAIGGISLIFGSALFRMYPHTHTLCGTELTGYHWVVLAGWVLFMGYGEGYKGFQRKFSPRVAARALYLKNNPTVVRVLLAPIFCMGFFHATRKRKMVSYNITAMVILLVIGVKHLAQPWRGIVDAGVLVGLGWGLVAVWIFSVKAFFGADFNVSPETPE